MKKLLGCGILVALLTVSAFGQATQPANLPLNFRATQAYNQGRYAAALPLLQELAGTLIDSPEKLGPVEEQIRVCKKAMDAAKKQQADPSVVAANAVPTPPVTADAGAASGSQRRRGSGDAHQRPGEF